VEKSEQPEPSERPVRARGQDRSRAEKTDRRSGSNGDDGTIGFGNDMPAFMRVAGKA
jgi:hypothetical protein